MLLELQVLAGLLTAAAAAYAATPVAMRAAVRLQFLDQPVGYKGHAKPTPYLGGSAVLAAFVVAALALAGHFDRTGPVVAGALVLWAVGTADDRVNLSPFLRLGIEFLVAGGLWAVGLGWDLGFGAAVDLAVTALWVAGVVNAFNLFDNMDGAAGTMACVVSGAVAVLGVVLGDTWLAVCGGALCGACLGFLPYNLSSPPRIFLGDGGSMPIGFVVAALVMIGASDAVREWQALAIALLLVGIPLLDTCLVVISRRRRGLSVLTGGRDHLTHRTRRRLTTVRAVAVALGTAQALLAVLALAAYRGGSVVLVIIVAAYVLAAALAIEVLDAGFSDERAEVEPEARRPRAGGQRLAAAGLLGLAFGVSPFYEGGYNSSLWAPGGLVVLALLLALVIGYPLRLSRPAKLALGALVALAAWSLVSVLWTSSVELGFVASNRMVVLAAILAVLVLVVSETRSALFALGGVVAGTVLVGFWSLGLMLAGDGGELFRAGRLNGPLGYVNAQGAVYGCALLPLLSLAEWRRSPRLAGLGAGLGALCLGLAVLSQSRGIVIALVAGLAVAFLVAPGRLRRSAALVAICLPVAAGAPWLLDVHQEGAAGAVSSGSIRGAAVAVLLGSIGSGLAWWLLARRSVSMSARGKLVARRGWAAALGLAAVAVLAVTIANAPQILDRAQEQYAAFVEGSGAVTPQDSRNRLLSGSGVRSDYWRIAYESWRERPLVGLGAGGYSLPYFQERRTTEAVRQPHSLELQVLAELGLVGLLLLAAWLAALAWAIIRAARRCADEPRRHLLIAASGLSVVWLVQTSVDWLHLIPGVTGMAFVAIAVLVRGDAAPQPAPLATHSGAMPARLARRGLLAAGGVCLLLGLLSLSRQALAEHYRARAQESLAQAAPADALELANRSIRIDGHAVSAYYLRWSALEQLNRPRQARRALSDALAREPQNFVTWALIGDFETRAGRPAAARRAYRRASALNPIDAELAELAGRAPD